MSRLSTWIVALTQLATLVLANPIYAPQFLSGGTGRNIRHLPCVSLRTGETGVCMFAFTCVKANGTHLGTCIDRFYFGSCCKLSDEPEVYPEDNTIDEGSGTSGFVTTDSAIESNDIPDYFTRPKPVAEKQPTSSTPSSASKIALVTTQSVQTSTEAQRKVVTKGQFSSTPYTTTQPPIGLSTFQTLHNYSQHGSNAFTTENVLKVTSTTPKRPLKTSSTESSNVVTTNGGTFRPRPSSGPSSGTKRPVILEMTTKRPPVHATKPAIASTQRPVTSTMRTPPSTRFPPRNATTTTSTSTTTTTTTRPLQLTTTRKPAQISGTRRPGGSTTRKPVTAPRPSSGVANSAASGTSATSATTGRPTTVTQKTSAKVTQTAKPPSTSTQEFPSVVPTRPTPSSVAGSSTESRPSQRPGTKRPAVTSGGDRVTTSRPATITTSRQRPPSRPTKPSTKPGVTASKTPVTLKTTPRPQQATTERTKPSSGSSSVTTSSRPSTSRPSSAASVRPKPTRGPTERPTKPVKITKPPRPSSTTIAAPNSTPSGTSSGTTSGISTGTFSGSSSGTSLGTSLTTEVPVTSSTFTGSTLTNEILPAVMSGTSATTTERATTHSPGLVTWSSNSDDDVTRGPEITSTTTTQEEATEPDWSPITTPDGWIMIQSPTTERPLIPDEAVNRPKPTTKVTTTSARPSTTTEPVTTPRPTIPTILSTIATVTTATDLPVPMETLNMSDYKQVCGRRLFPESRIVGGENSTFGKWPWQISLRQWRTKAYLHKCGAALLNENWAITAAHCVENVPPSDLLLRIGEHDLANEDEPYGFQERRVQIVASHPQFDPRTFEYDLALLRFYEPLEPFQPNILPVCLPDDDENYVGHSAYVTGWGRLFEDGPLPSVLQEVSVPVINNTLCEGMYRNAGYIEHIPHIFICAGWRKGGFDSCEGDSGGPMVIRRPRDKRWILAGVISWGIGCAEPNQPGVYTRISEFREWINQILQF